MDTQVIRIDPKVGHAEAVRRATDVVMRGGLVVFPTETVYGVAARADDPAAVDRLRSVKSRDADQAFTVHLGAPSDAERFVPAPTGVARRFMRKAWPGPLTLILPVEDPASTPAMAEVKGSAGTAMYYRNTIGLRCPDDAVAAALLAAAEAPTVAASANPAGTTPPFTGKEALALLGGQIDLLLDAGQTKYSKPSTIVRITPSSYDLVREGVFDAGIVERLSKLRLLLVCTGNTCRSPMAAGMARHMIAERLGCEVAELPERGIYVESAGTAGGFGRASAHAVAVMRRRGIDVTDHVSTELSRDTIALADHVFAMTGLHRDRILEMLPPAERRVELLLDGEDVRDPIGGSEEDYEACAQTVEAGLRVRLQEVNL